MVPRQCGWLSELPLLHVMHMGDNPVRGEQYYRENVLFRCHRFTSRAGCTAAPALIGLLCRLTRLDDEAVTAEEKVKARNLFGADSEVREQRVA